MENELTIEAPVAEALEILTKAEFDVLINAARANPRDVMFCRKQVQDVASADAETAASCFFALPRKRKTKEGKYENTTIEGESIRMAEIVASMWQNVRTYKRILSLDRKTGTITAQATVRDLEKITEATVEETKSIRDKDGSLFSEDRISMQGRSAESVAVSNAVFTVIPKAIFASVFKKIKAVATGEKEGTMDDDFVQTSLPDRAANAVKYFVNLGVAEQAVYDLLKVEDMDHITNDDLEQLTGLRTALSEGDTKLVDIFPPSKGDQVKASVQSKIGAK